MKRLVMVAALVSTNAMALDFDTEWAKFADDFARLRPVKTIKDSPVVNALPQLDSDVIQVDPKSPERLGLKLTDPAMREKVAKLYQKPETVVYSTTIR
jgi:hypothetical protein